MMANRCTLECVNKFRSGDNKASKTLLTQKWIELINIAEKSKKNTSKISS